jgi:hypothetical protein
MNDLAKQLETIAAHAPRLRNAGVKALRVGEISMELTPAESVPIIEAKGDEKPSRGLDDAVTYGLPEGADVPGFRRPDGM